ncbi:tyrosine-type recombinase/integrase [Rhodococcus sp. SG20037]|uniref:tyrosine-type recombinase/integrase n=1 Tax=Rhodococcus sp. SG20037 TaxID=3074148 RepID=UPI00287FBD3B|nr:tyrosine-type recombinase/integrase [Rhodococcus sp. SG20037]WNF39621.1 tyrosine-type recombinase/integrase [Rhodococcus sp. SG20037]
MVWSAVDLDAGAVHIRQARTALGPREDRIDIPKSERSRRVVPLDPREVAALRRMKRQQAEDRLAVGAAWVDEDGLIAVHEDGRRVRPEWFTATFRYLVTEAGRPKVRLHDLRGTLSSVMAEAGVPVEVRSALLGHDDKVNTDRYTAISSEAMAAGDAGHFRWVMVDRRHPPPTDARVAVAAICRSPMVQ